MSIEALGDPLRIRMSIEALGDPLRMKTRGQEGSSSSKKNIKNVAKIQQEQVRSWMIVNREGRCQTLEVGKKGIRSRARLPARDLRMLEPALCHPSTIIAGREHAIVFNVEYIKVIITATELLLFNSPHPAVAPFAQLLLHRLSLFKGQAIDAGRNANKCPSKNGESPSKPLLKDGQHQDIRDTEDDQPIDLTDIENRSSKALPFEFRALEVCLEETCNCLERETTNLEEEAYPILDELTTNISTLNLERVRQIKSRLVAISCRIQKVRDALEHLLDHDSDMAEMYLTDKMLQQQLQERTLDLQVLSDESKPADVLHNGPASSVANRSHRSEIGNRSKRSEIGNRSQRSEIGNDHGSMHFYVAELEMLLEAYFVQIDGMLNKLSSLREYVDNTEDCINIMLDDKQNQLLQLGVILSTVNLSLGLCICIVGYLSINIHIKLWETGFPQFMATVIGLIFGAFTLIGSAIAWYKKKGLLE